MTSRTPPLPAPLPGTVAALPDPGAALPDSAREVARRVLVRGPVSRGELARELRLSVASLTRLTKPLLDAGLLREGALLSDGTVGRPVRLLDVRPDAGYFLGVKVTGEELQAVVTDLRATVLGQATAALPATTPDAVVHGIATLAGQLAARAGVTLTAVGVSLGGQVHDGGLVQRAPFLHWQQVPLGDLLTRRLGVPVVVDNDVAALAVAEQWFGVGKRTANFALLTIGAGVGYGLVLHNRVLRTPDTGLGLGGHLPLVADGPPCPLGHRGCATSLLSSPSVCAQVSAGLGRPVSYAEALALAAAGEPVATAVITAAARALGRLIALTADLAMVATVVLGGEGIGLFAVAEDTVRAAVAADRDPQAREVRLVPASADFTDWARGAAAVAIAAHAFGSSADAVAADAGRSVGVAADAGRADAGGRRAVG